MPLTEAKKRANNKYISSHYARLNIQYPTAYVERIKAEAEARGESIAGFVKIAIDKRLEEAPGQEEGKDPR